MSKQKKKKADGLPAPVATPSTMPRPLALASATLCAVGALMLVALFVRAIPDAGQRAKAGLLRVSEGACEGLHPDPVNEALGEMPTAAPDFSLKDYAGRSVKLSDMRGDVVLLNFWATWCSTCVVEMGSMERLVSRMKGKPFRLVAVSVDESWDPVRKFFPHGTPLEVLLDVPHEVPKRYGTSKFPESFLIDRDGQIRQYIVSNRNWDTGEVQACVESLL